MSWIHSEFGLSKTMDGMWVSQSKGKPDKDQPCGPVNNNMKQVMDKELSPPDERGDN